MTDPNLSWWGKLPSQYHKVLLNPSSPRRGKTQDSAKAPLRCLAWLTSHVYIPELERGEGKETTSEITSEDHSPKKEAEAKDDNRLIAAAVTQEFSPHLHELCPPIFDLSGKDSMTGTSVVAPSESNSDGCYDVLWMENQYCRYAFLPDKDGKMILMQTKHRPSIFQKHEKGGHHEVSWDGSSDTVYKTVNLQRETSAKKREESIENETESSRGCYPMISFELLGYQTGGTCEYEIVNDAQEGVAHLLLTSYFTDQHIGGSQSHTSSWAYQLKMCRKLSLYPNDPSLFIETQVYNLTAFTQPLRYGSCVCSPSQPDKKIFMNNSPFKKTRSDRLVIETSPPAAEKKNESEFQHFFSATDEKDKVARLHGVNTLYDVTNQGTRKSRVHMKSKVDEQDQSIVFLTPPDEKRNSFFEVHDVEGTGICQQRGSGSAMPYSYGVYHKASGMGLFHTSGCYLDRIASLETPADGPEGAQIPFSLSSNLTDAGFSFTTSTIHDVSSIEAFSIEEKEEVYRCYSQPMAIRPFAMEQFGHYYTPFCFLPEVKMPSKEEGEQEEETSLMDAENQVILNVSSDFMLNVNSGTSLNGAAIFSVEFLQTKKETRENKKKNTPSSLKYQKLCVAFFQEEFNNDATIEESPEEWIALSRNPCETILRPCKHPPRAQDLIKCFARNEFTLFPKNEEESSEKNAEEVKCVSEAYYHPNDFWSSCKQELEVSIPQCLSKEELMGVFGALQRKQQLLQAEIEAKKEKDKKSEEEEEEEEVSESRNALQHVDGYVWVPILCQVSLESQEGPSAEGWCRFFVPFQATDEKGVLLASFFTGTETSKITKSGKESIISHQKEEAKNVSGQQQRLETEVDKMKWLSNDDLFLHGQDILLMTNEKESTEEPSTGGTKTFKTKKEAELQAEKYFLLALKRDSQDVRCNTVMARIAYYRGNVMDAEAYLRQALDRVDTPLPSQNRHWSVGEVYYLFGLIYLAKFSLQPLSSCLTEENSQSHWRNLKLAMEDGFGKALNDSNVRPMAHFSLAVCFAILKQWRLSLRHSEESIAATNGQNQGAHWLRYLSLRKLGIVQPGGEDITTGMDLTHPCHCTKSTWISSRLFPSSSSSTSFANTSETSRLYPFDFMLYVENQILERHLHSTNPGGHVCFTCSPTLWMYAAIQYFNLQLYAEALWIVTELKRTCYPENEIFDVDEREDTASVSSHLFALTSMPPLLEEFHAGLHKILEKLHLSTSISEPSSQVPTSPLRSRPSIVSEIPLTALFQLQYVPKALEEYLLLQRLHDVFSENNDKGLKGGGEFSQVLSFDEEGIQSSATRSLLLQYLLGNFYFYQHQTNQMGRKSEKTKESEVEQRDEFALEAAYRLWSDVVQQSALIEPHDLTVTSKNPFLVEAAIDHEETQLIQDMFVKLKTGHFFGKEKRAKHRESILHQESSSINSDNMMVINGVLTSVFTPEPRDTLLLVVLMSLVSGTKRNLAIVTHMKRPPAEKGEKSDSVTIESKAGQLYRHALLLLTGLLDGHLLTVSRNPQLHPFHHRLTVLFVNAIKEHLLAEYTQFQRLLLIPPQNRLQFLEAQMMVNPLRERQNHVFSPRLLYELSWLYNAVGDPAKAKKILLRNEMKRCMQKSCQQTISYQRFFYNLFLGHMNFERDSSKVAFDYFFDGLKESRKYITCCSSVSTNVSKQPMPPRASSMSFQRRKDFEDSVTKAYAVGSQYQSSVQAPWTVLQYSIALAYHGMGKPTFGQEHWLAGCKGHHLNDDLLLLHHNERQVENSSSRKEGKKGKGKDFSDVTTTMVDKIVTKFYQAMCMRKLRDEDGCQEALHQLKQCAAALSADVVEELDYFSDGDYPTIFSFPNQVIKKLQYYLAQGFYALGKGEYLLSTQHFQNILSCCDPSCLWAIYGLQEALPKTLIDIKSTEVSYLIDPSVDEETEERSTIRTSADTYNLRTKKCCVSICPALGMRIYSLKVLETEDRNENEWLWFPGRELKLMSPCSDLSMSVPCMFESFYSREGELMQGWNEVFPTIAPCKGYPDRGEVRSTSCHPVINYLYRAVTVNTGCLGTLPVSFSRTVRFVSEETLRLEYSVKKEEVDPRSKGFNANALSQPFLWSVSPTFPLNNLTRLHVPQQLHHLIFCEDAFNIPHVRIGQKIPFDGQNWLAKLDLPKDSYLKFCIVPDPIGAKKGTIIELYKQNGSMLAMRWDHRQLPVVRVIIQNGECESAAALPGHHRYISIQPCTSMTEAVNAVPVSEAKSFLKPKGCIEWWIEVTAL